MIRKNLVVFLATICVLKVLAETSSAAIMSSSSYQIAASVLSGGGGRMSSSSYVLTGTIGQPSPLGATTGEGFESRSGFWESVASFTMRGLGLSPAIYLLLLSD